MESTKNEIATRFRMHLIPAQTRIIRDNNNSDNSVTPIRRIWDSRATPSHIDLCSGDIVANVNPTTIDRLLSNSLNDERLYNIYINLVEHPENNDVNNIENFLDNYYTIYKEMNVNSKRYSVVFSPVYPSGINSRLVCVYTVDTTVVSNNNQNALICSICQYAINSNDNGIVNTSCHHSFHDNCITLWLQSRNTCPNCSTLIVY